MFQRLLGKLLCTLQHLYRKLKLKTPWTIEIQGCQLELNLYQMFNSRILRRASIDFSLWILTTQLGQKEIMIHNTWLKVLVPNKTPLELLRIYIQTIQTCSRKLVSMIPPEFSKEKEVRCLSLSTTTTILMKMDSKLRLITSQTKRVLSQ